MVEAIDRVHHIKETIGTLREELRGRTIDNLVADRLDWAGYRYLLQVISDIPNEWKLAHGRKSIGGRSKTSAMPFGMAITTWTSNDFGRSISTTSIRSKPLSIA
jgi:hypothetical protein